ncbi:MAG: ferritin [Puniceicoccales bacterium]|nr:ferritin [Puniceicoccales bacterium]
MKQQLFDLFQAQIRNELESAYKYLGMAAYFETTPFKGFASWMRLQAKEEIEHATKFFDYVHDRGHHLQLPAIQAVATEYASPLEAFCEALAHEQLVTRLINGMYRVAIEVEDYAAQILLQWYIAEQVEEETQAQDFIDRLEMADGDVSSLLIIDKSAGKRSS